MKPLAIVVLISLFVGAAAQVSSAEKVSPVDPGGPDSPGFCDIEGYKTETDVVETPIEDLGTFTTPPLTVGPAGGTIVDVVIGLDIEHTWMGDLNVAVNYDPDCAGPLGPIGPVYLLARQGRAGFSCDGSPFGCGGDLDSGSGIAYTFGTIGSSKEIADATQCTEPIAFGCYDEALESPSELTIFVGLPKDGCWTLDVTDCAGGDSGILHSWGVAIDNRVSPVANTSWGAIKATYK